MAHTLNSNADNIVTSDRASLGPKPDSTPSGGEGRNLGDAGTVDVQGDRWVFHGIEMDYNIPTDHGDTTDFTVDGIATFEDNVTVGGTLGVTGVATVGGLRFSDTVWDDIRITPTELGFGLADPKMVDVVIGSWTFKLPEFAKNDVAYATVQMPHGYKAGTALHVHIHWTPGAYGVEQRGNAVGWKVQVSMAGIGNVFLSSEQLDLGAAVPSDCDDYQHLMSTSVAFDVPSGFGESACMLVRITRTDTGTDDTWSETLSGRLPLLVEIDFHYEIEKIGTDDEIPD